MARQTPYDRILEWMKIELRCSPELYITFPPVGEPSATALAEEAIIEGVASDDAWTDEAHPVWDAAVDAVAWYNGE